MATKDSKAGLGKGIADDLDSDEEEEEDDEEKDTSDDDSDEEEDASGTRGETGEGKPEGQKGEKKDKDEEEDSDSEPPLTKADLDRAVTQAVSESVGKANSSKDKEIATLRKQNKETEESLRKEIEETGLRGLSEEDRTKMRQVHANDRAQREIATQREEAGDMSRIANAARLGVDQARFGEHGATVAELEACDSPEAQEALCSQKERDYWRGVAQGDISITDADGASSASKNGKEKGKRKKSDAPAGSRKSTDVGGSGAAPPKGEKVTTMDAFAQDLLKTGAVPSGGITRVEDK